MNKIINTDKALETIERLRRDATYKRNLEQKSAEKYCEGYQDGLDKAEAILTNREFESDSSGKFEVDIFTESCDNKIYIVNPLGEKCDVTESAIKAVFDWFMLSGKGSVTFPSIPYKLTLTNDEDGEQE